MSGSAVAGLDYTLSTGPGQLIIAAGQRTATVTLTALKGLNAKSGQTATMSLQSGTGYSLGSAGTSTPASTVTIN